MKAKLTAMLLACSILLAVSPAVHSSPMQTAPIARPQHYGSPLTSQTFNGVQRDYASYASQLNDVAYQLIKQGNYTEAEGRLRQAIAFEPDFVNAHCNLGFILNKTGRASEGLPHLQYAYRLAPNEPAILECLAAAYQLRGNFKSAIDAYNQYLYQFPSAPDAPLIHDMVTHLRMESAQNSIAGAPNDFNWKKNHVKVFIAPADGVSGFQPQFNEILKSSFVSWSEAGVISFELVPTAEESDIECVWTDDVKKLSSVGEGGETSFKKSNGAISHAKITLLTKRAGSQPALSERDVRALCLHEIGHSLGLVKHNTSPDSVMFCTLASSKDPSLSDLQNLRALYR